MKNLYLIIGPSGSGKTELAKNLAEKHGMKSVESYTTRPPRYLNEPGHIFVTDDEFDALGEMCAYTEYNGYRYGVTKDILDASDIYVIDPVGAVYLADHYSGKDFHYIWLVTSPEVCYERMLSRGDDEATAKKRVEYDKDAFGLDQVMDLRMRILGDSITTDRRSAEQVFDIVWSIIEGLEFGGRMSYFKCCLNCVAPKRYPGCSIKCKEYADEKERYESDKARARKCYILDNCFIGGNKSYAYGDS